MTTLTPILYADGALRLTDHGPRGGGLVLVLEEGPSTRQLDLPYNTPGAGAVVAGFIGREVEAMERCNYEPEVIFEQIAKAYSVPSRGGAFTPRYPGFHPFYHG